MAPDPAFGVTKVTKVAAYVPVSNDLLMDAGVIPDTRPRPRVPWRRRLRWRLSAMRERAAERAYRLISGRDFPGHEW